MMQEEFNIGILIKQNQSLSTQLHSYRTQISQLTGQLTILTNRSRTFCRYFTKILSQLQSGQANNESICMLIERMLSAMQSGINEQQQQPIKMQQSELKIKQEQQQPIRNDSSSKENKTNHNSLIIEEQSSLIKIENVPFNHCLLHSLYEQQQINLQALQDQNNLLKRRIVLLGNYSCSSVDKIIEANQHLCYCGGLQMSYYNKKMEELIELKKKQLQHPEPSAATTMEADIQPNPQTDTTASALAEQIKMLTNRLIAAQKKVHDCKLNHKVTLDLVLSSEAYQILKNQAKELMFFVSQLMGKLQNYGQYLRLIEQERAKQIESMMEMNRVNMEQFKPESIFDRNSGAVAVLEEMRRNYSEFMDLSKVLATKIKERFKHQLEEADLVKNLRKQIHELQKSRGGSHNEVGFLPHKYTFLQKNIPRVLQSNEAYQFCKGTQLRVEIMIKDWKWFVSYFKGHLREVEDLKEQLREKQDQKEFLVAIYNEIKEMFDHNRESMKKIQESFSSMELKINELEFAFGDYRAKQYFRLANEQKIKKGFEERMALVAAAEKDLIQVVEDRARIYELVQRQTVQFKKQQGEYLAAVQGLKQKTAYLQKVNEEKEGSINRLLQDKVKYQLEIDRLKQRVASNEVESESSLQMKKLIEKYREKISCICGRGNEANVALNCRHIFCKSCVEKVVKSRKRCCPICSAKFSETEVHHFMYND